MGKWLNFFKREERNQDLKSKNQAIRKEEILDCIARNNFSEIGIDLQLIEEVFYRGLEAGIIKIVPSADGGVKISISNLQIETFPIKIARKDILKYFYYDD